jgi:hypothetical protein
MVKPEADERASLQSVAMDDGPRLTYALKLLMVIVLAFYAGQFILEVLSRIRGVVYILIGSVFPAYLIYPAVQRLRRRMPLVLAIVLVYVIILVVAIRSRRDCPPSCAAKSRRRRISWPPESRPAGRSRSVISLSCSRGRLPSSRSLSSFRWLRRICSSIRSIFAGACPRLFRSSGGTQRFRFFPMSTMLSAASFGGTHCGVVGWRADHRSAAVAHVPYPFLFGVLAAFGDLIPYVGAVLALIPAFTSSVLQNGWINALLVTAAFVAIFEAEGHLIGAELGGLFGMLVAVPVAGVLHVIALRVVRAANPK